MVPMHRTLLPGLGWDVHPASRDAIRNKGLPNTPRTEERGPGQDARSSDIGKECQRESGLF